MKLYVKHLFLLTVLINISSAILVNAEDSSAEPPHSNELPHQKPDLREALEKLKKGEPLQPEESKGLYGVLQATYSHACQLEQENQQYKNTLDAALESESLTLVKKLRDHLNQNGIRGCRAIGSFLAQKAKKQLKDPQGEAVDVQVTSFAVSNLILQKALQDADISEETKEHLQLVGNSMVSGAVSHRLHASLIKGIELFELENGRVCKRLGLGKGAANGWLFTGVAAGTEMLTHSSIGQEIGEQTGLNYLPGFVRSGSKLLFNYHAAHYLQPKVASLVPYIGTGAYTASGPLALTGLLYLAHKSSLGQQVADKTKFNKLPESAKIGLMALMSTALWFGAKVTAYLVLESILPFGVSPLTIPLGSDLRI